METQEKTTQSGKTKMPSSSYTLKAIGEHANKLHQLELITETEKDTIKSIQKKAIEKYMKLMMQ